MANTENLIPIPGRLKNVAVGGHVAGADMVYDDTIGKTQEEINSDVGSNKADKTSTVSNVTYDSSSRKIQKTINGTTTDVVTLPEAQVNSDWNASSGVAQILNKPSSLPASDVSAWAKAPNKPSYTKGEVGLGNVDDTADADKHVAFADDAGTVNNHTVNTDVPSGAVFTDTTYESKTAAEGGTDVSLVTTGEKYNWNNKVEKGEYSKELHAGLADNLFGETQTNDMFTFRPTAGIQDIESGEPPLGGASVKKMEGNSVSWNQLVQNGDFSDGTTGWIAETGVTATVSDGIYTLTKEETYNLGCARNFNLIESHVYICRLFVKASAGLSVGTNGFTIIVTTTGGWDKLTGFVTEVGANRKMGVGTYAASTIQVRDINLFDLTLIFGEGHEPETVAEFESWLERNIGLKDYYPYNTGELIPVKDFKVKSVGFNAWDEEWEVGGFYYSGVENDTKTSIRSKNYINVLSSQTYCIKGERQYVIFYDSEKNYIGTDEFNSILFTTPSNCQYIKFDTKDTYGTTYNHDICISLSYDDDKDGTYEEHWEHETAIDVTTLKGKLNGAGDSVVVFPDGLKSAGTVHDEIVKVGDVTKAIKRIGSVDLGSLTWTKRAVYLDQSKNQFETTGIASTVRMPDSATQVQTWAITPMYNNVISAEINSPLDKSFTIKETTGIVVINDFTYSDSTEAQFATAMQGVILYYELATPKEYIIDDALLPVKYAVDDYGTEELLLGNDTEVVSVAPTMTIKYGINAADTVASLPHNYVSSKYQSLNDEEKKTARNNIGAASQKDMVRVDNAVDGLLDAMEKYDWRITSYVINQTEVNGNYRLPGDMIVDHSASMDSTETITVNGETVYKDAIRRIRENSHLYIGRYNTTTGKLEARQVSDTDKTKWTDGTSITWGTEDDLFMKLPKFWWKCKKVQEDIYKVSFSDVASAVDETWNLWEGDTFIGVYEAVINNNKVYSKSGVTPTVNESWTTFTADARARYNNNNYRLVTYEAHQIMCLLGWGWLGTTNDQSVVGAGTSNYPKTTGLTDSKGMNDSKAAVDGNSTSINFWGLENWWGDIYEWTDNIMTAGSYNVNVLGDDRTTVSRLVTTNLSGNDGEIKKMVLGANGDVVPKKITTNRNYDRCYTVGGSVARGAGRVVLRSASAADLLGGLGFFFAVYGVGNVTGHIGSRLLYKGDYIIVSTLN